MYSVKLYIQFMIINAKHWMMEGSFPLLCMCSHTPNELGLVWSNRMFCSIILNKCPRGVSTVIQAAPSSGLSELGDIWAVVKDRGVSLNQPWTRVTWCTVSLTSSVNSEEVRHECTNHYKFSALRSRYNVQPNAPALVVICACMSDLLWCQLIIQ